MRVCYLVQSHRPSAQLLRLVGTLKRLSPECLVLVAHDASGGPLEISLFRAWSDVELLNVPGPARRGHLSLLDPYLRGAERLRALDIDYDWLVYLSAQDYPVQPLERSEAFLAAADCDGFLRHWPALAPVRGRVRDRRYRYRYVAAPSWLASLRRAARAINRMQSLIHLHLTFEPRIGLRRLRLPLPEGWILYRGYQWTTLRRHCVEHLLDAIARERSVIEYFGTTICPDEAVVQTFLVNARRFRLADDDLRYLQTGHTRDGRARILGIGDLPELLSGRYHFARKFDIEADAAVLDRLDDELG
jgi:hypothetical protein